MTARWIFVFGFAAALLTSLGCSNGGSDGSVPPALACTDSGPAGANGVTMTCAGPTDSTTEQVDVVIGGPASGSTTLRGLNFDVPYDATKLEFVPAATYTSPLIPGALVGVSLQNGQPGRVVVSIQQVGGAPDVSVASGQQVVAISLSFRTVAGITVAPTALIFESDETTGASAAVTFSSGLMLSYQ
jgi:hypothetical protein